MLVPLSRACLVFDTSQVPPAALEGLAQYSHFWILYVFHLNTNLDKLWKEPANLKFKAKVCCGLFSYYFIVVSLLAYFYIEDVDERVIGDR